MYIRSISGILTFEPSLPTMTSHDGSSSPTHSVDVDEVEKISPSHTNREGTVHQLALGPKPKRKHFFSALDSSYADAVHQDAESVHFTTEEEVRAQ